MEEILHQLIGSLSHYLGFFCTFQVVVWTNIPPLDIRKYLLRFGSRSVCFWGGSVIPYSGSV